MRIRLLRNQRFPLKNEVLTFSKKGFLAFVVPFCYLGARAVAHPVSSNIGPGASIGSWIISYRHQTADTQRLWFYGHQLRRQFCGEIAPAVITVIRPCVFFTLSNLLMCLINPWWLEASGAIVSCKTLGNISRMDSGSIIIRPNFRVKRLLEETKLHVKMHFV